MVGLSHSWLNMGVLRHPHALKGFLLHFKHCSVSSKLVVTHQQQLVFGTVLDLFYISQYLIQSLHLQCKTNNKPMASRIQSNRQLSDNLVRILEWYKAIRSNGRLFKLARVVLRIPKSCKVSLKISLSYCPTASRSLYNIESSILPIELTPARHSRYASFESPLRSWLHVEDTSRIASFDFPEALQRWSISREETVRHFPLSTIDFSHGDCYIALDTG